MFRELGRRLPIYCSRLALGVPGRRLAKEW